MDPISSIRTMSQPVASDAARALRGTVDAGNSAVTRSIGEIELKNLNLPTTDGVKGASFENMLGSLVKDVSARSAQSAAMTNSLLAGGNVPLHQVMIASEEASLSFQLMVEVRNKLLESYQELMRMQV